MGQIDNSNNNITNYSYTPYGSSKFTQYPRLINFRITPLRIQSVMYFSCNDKVCQCHILQTTMGLLKGEKRGGIVQISKKTQGVLV